MNDYLKVESGENICEIQVRGRWTFEQVPDLYEMLDDLDVDPGAGGEIVFQCGGLERVDLSGAWMLHRRAEVYREDGVEVRFEGFKAEHFKFLDQVTDLPMEMAKEATAAPKPDELTGLLGFMDTTGRATVEMVKNLGYITHALYTAARYPGRLFWRESIRQIKEVGVDAMPLVALISFLIGIVLAYGSSAQLRTLGAEIFVVDLVAISMFREMGVLLAAIMLAGRSASAFAASLGQMQLNEEVDALRVLGLNPMKILVAPRLLAVLIALPLLAGLANLAGLVGGWVLSSMVLDISTRQFVDRAAEALSMNDLIVGLVKAPVFAITIAGIGALRGMEVRRSAEELGRNTTQAVVESIILIIIADAVFAMVFAQLGL